MEQADPIKPPLDGSPIGIDVGLKNFAILSNGFIYGNQNKSSRLQRIRKRFRRLQRKLSRQYRALKARKLKEGRSATDLNLAKTQLKVQRLYQRLTNIQIDYQNKIVATVVRTKPQWVALEDLNVSGMMKNRHLAKAIAQQGFYNLKVKLIAKCRQLGIPVHLTGRFEPTSKLCHNCGAKKVSLKLSERTYRCPNCHYTNDHDVNAVLNIRDTANFVLAY
ncbi:RNA-guided endonuclease InsQ/TnpB family protein [Secundilactobacillus hailunensis]|uniref:RNA-guided endonuclease InsQ/TnpB family protein n=1 Tax=Secundilactobacillus hailunensis TaxID=2559923 RepID=A0ABW1T4Y7_9LACO|nr:RNA-guided endonuclease TnpB family protein [Secundilactobacillus hailunensis]